MVRGVRRKTAQVVARVGRRPLNRRERPVQELKRRCVSATGPGEKPAVEVELY